MSELSASDAHFMARALDEALRGQYTTSPNPMVGCVIVKDGRVIADGFHERAGGPHAEIVALDRAGDDARGATVYVTLEPCSHQGRTGPCADRLVNAGIARCVVATRDPNPKVAGRGIARLREAGITVDIGVDEERARRINEFFITAMERGRPFVTAKFAASLDGRVATRRGSSKWISSPESRAHAHDLRSLHDMVLVGAGTVVADDPQLTARGIDGRNLLKQPWRVILDARLRIPDTARVLGPGSIVVTTRNAPEYAVAAVTARGSQVVRVAASDNGVDLDAVVSMLHERECRSLLVEGGPRILGAFFDAGLVDRVVAYIAPFIIGGEGARSAVDGTGIGDLADVGRLREVEVDRRGDDFVVTGYC